MIGTLIDRWIIRCRACKLTWLIEESPFRSGHAIAHLGECSGNQEGPLRFGLVILRIVHRGVRPALHCRMSESRQVPPPSREPTLEGPCSWNCRGSQSPSCYCPCGGKHHGATHVYRKWHPEDFKDSGTIALYEQIERAKPRGDWKGRKST